MKEIPNTIAPIARIAANPKIDRTQTSAEKSRKIPKNFKIIEEAFGFREAITNPAPASGGPIGPADATRTLLIGSKNSGPE
jgi:hypothetical protein